MPHVNVLVQRNCYRPDFRAARHCFCCKEVVIIVSKKNEKTNRIPLEWSPVRNNAIHKLHLEVFLFNHKHVTQISIIDYRRYTININLEVSHAWNEHKRWRYPKQSHVWSWDRTTAGLNVRAGVFHWKISEMKRVTQEEYTKQTKLD